MAQMGREVVARLDAHPNVRQAKVTAAAIYYHLNFLSDQECDTLINLIESKNELSGVLGDKEYDTDFRNSHSSYLDRWADEVLPLDDRVADLLGIPRENAETLQGQRYMPGQQFLAHQDWFHKDCKTYERTMSTGGQRTWTAMIYLNDVEGGGETWFPQAGIRVAPRRGMLLVWNNMHPDGTPNLATIHEGCKVTSGVKYIVTKWFRERPWFDMPAGYRGTPGTTG